MCASLGEAGLVSRLNRLTPKNERRWGEMEISKLLPHLGDALRMALGDIETSHGKGLMATALMRRLIIHVLPWPKGQAKSPPEGSRRRLLLGMRTVLSCPS